MTKREAEKRIKKLREEISHHRYLTHVLDKQEISEAALDTLKAELSRLEAQFPALITPDSPTQRIGGKPLPKFLPLQHRIPMLSLHDAFSGEDLQAWEERNKKIIPTDFQYFVQPKIDGLAVSLIYQDGAFVQGATRGDGRVGEDVTQNLRTIEAIPLRLRALLPGRVEVRGEVYMLKKDFERLNRQRQQKGLSLFANPRNIAAGSIRQLDPAATRTRPLRFFAWELTEGVPVKTRQEESESLKDLGFPVPPDSVVRPTLPAVQKYLEEEEKKREGLPFQVDGAVVKINNLEHFKRLGIIGKAPRGAIAYKFAAEEATTIVEDIIVQVGRTGALTPVANLRPVRVAGTTVSRATLHNAAEIERKDVRVGDTVIVRKAGDIIPEVVKVLPKLRPSRTKPFVMPKRCPICKSSVKRDEGGVILRCTNSQCFPQQRERILHTVRAFDIEGLGEKIVEQLLQEGLIKDAADLWQLKEGDLLPLERFADKSARKLVEEIQAHKKISLARFLMALSITHVGTVTAQDIAREFHTLDKILKATAGDFNGIAGIGDKVALAIVDYLHAPGTQQLIKKFKQAGIHITAEKASGPLNGKTFVFTGGLDGMTREEAKQRVQSLGGKVASTVGGNVNYVVVGAEAGSKGKKAQELGVAILTPQQFRQMIGG